MVTPPMSRLLAAVAVAALALAGREASNVSRSAAVTISGRVLRADSFPAAGVAVGLERQPTVGEIVTGLVIVPLTLFTACLADPPPALCRGRDVRRTTTAADGSYAFRLTGGDTRTDFGNARTLSLSAELPPAAGEVAGAAVTAGFKVQTADLALKDLQMWQPRVTVAAGRIGWDPLADAGTYTVVVEDAGGQPVWSFDGRGREVAFDPRILEDTAGALAVSTQSSTTAEGTTVDVVRRSARVGYRSAAGPPLSRGKPCDHGTVAVAPCALTDGNLADRLPPPAPAGPSTTVPATTAPAAVDSATIDLGRPTTFALVVVRGCTCEVEGSPDGRTWSPLGRSTGYTAVVPGRTGSARFVRVTGALTDLGEVSVWEGQPPANR
jgi:hypothetical protein